MSTSGGGGYDPAYGGIPQLPMPTSTAGSAIFGDLDNLSSLLTLINGLQAGQEQSLLNTYNTAVPGWSDLTKTASGVAGENLKGEVPQDVISQLTQQAAERGISTGSPGSPNANAAYLRALGLTSLGQEQTGFQQLGQLTTTAPIVQPQNPMPFMVTPAEQQSAAAAQAIYNSAPIPAAAAAKAIQTAGGGGGTSTPWWAQGPNAGAALGPGTTSVGGTYHTPAAF